MRGAARFLGIGLAAASAMSTAALAETTANAPEPASPPAMSSAPPAAPAHATFSPVDDSQPDMWIFSGVLPGNKETFSGTLVSGKVETEFELRLADGATCDGSELKGDVGLVRLSEIACSDGRSMRALFVPQGGKALKVFGHVGAERFMASAHLLGTEAEPEKPQTAQPTAPQVQPPDSPIGPDPDPR